MRIFKKKNKGPVFFDEEPVDVMFGTLADFVKKLETRQDFNKAVGAMELIFNARQRLKGIKTDDDAVDDSMKFILHEKDGE